MIDKIKELMKKYEEIIVYLIVGVMTTIFSFAACFVGAGEALKLTISGGAIFTIMTWLFSSVQDRLSTGPAAKAAPVVSAFGLYLAIQALMGMIL